MKTNNWTYWELVERYGDKLGKRMYEEQEAAIAYYEQRKLDVKNTKSDVYCS